MKVFSYLFYSLIALSMTHTDVFAKKTYYDDPRDAEEVSASDEEEAEEEEEKPKKKESSKLKSAKEFALKEIGLAVRSDDFEEKQAKLCKKGTFLVNKKSLRSDGGVIGEDANAGRMTHTFCTGTDKSYEGSELHKKIKKTCGVKNDKGLSDDVKTWLRENKSQEAGLARKVVKKRSGEDSVPKSWVSAAKKFK